MGLEELRAAVPRVAVDVFGDQVDRAATFAQLLARHGVERGLIGPREVDRLWDRHLLNSAVIGECIPEGARVIDVGSGAGLPGIPLAISRPDLDMVLLEPMARRVDWLTEAVEALGLAVTVERGRAEDKAVQARIGLADVVTARAVAPLGRLARWCLPLVRQTGLLLALKGASADEEIERDGDAVHAAGGGEPRLVRCGVEVLETPTTVVVIERVAASKSGGKRRGGSKRR
ncbi:16S rRNA (guanine(527)-N(7))-methyltransferase GidB [Saccharomonospora marina XMU15]|uniref:Ribosomal RNA small subunit methyltransferase G n=1 Tax=Saccharomonospora marina XMU15 TaxID=882083 RepID=H5WX43_9PSEU|nr:16S rRNA (guanine(527)-N(7))-methyltransferase RsmG [Saccharomonospora marina]EHR53895.1 16S rRNA (guanine(527)-N(7))-methyltransferase GidB [Saccharomonospora marina XMU15]